MIKVRVSTNVLKFSQILKLYDLIKDKIIKRLNEFQYKWQNGNDEDIFAELIFCILTPQSRAKICWNAVINLINKNLLFSDNKNNILNELTGVRFKYKKSEYIIEAKKYFLKGKKIQIHDIIENFNDNFLMRDYFIKNIKGFGYKEASHFLRNIGFGNNFAILDRHILRSLYNLGVINKIPDIIGKKNYLDIEKKMQFFSKEININLDHLDLLLWYKQTNEIFK